MQELLQLLLATPLSAPLMAAATEVKAGARASRRRLTSMIRQLAVQQGGYFRLFSCLVTAATRQGCDWVPAAAATGGASRSPTQQGEGLHQSPSLTHSLGLEEGFRGSDLLSTAMSFDSRGHVGGEGEAGPGAKGSVSRLAANLLDQMRQLMSRWWVLLGRYRAPC